MFSSFDQLREPFCFYMGAFESVNIKSLYYRYFWHFGQ